MNGADLRVQAARLHHRHERLTRFESFADDTKPQGEAPAWRLKAKKGRLPRGERQAAGSHILEREADLRGRSTSEGDCTAMRVQCQTILIAVRNSVCTRAISSEDVGSRRR